MEKVRLIVTTTFGLESIVKRELEDLGFKDFVVADGKIEFDAMLSDIPRLNLWLRCADRVLVKIGEFKAVDFGKLFDQIKVLPWEKWLTKEGKITVIGKSVKSILESVRSCQSITKKAIIERLKAQYNIDWLPESGPEFTVQVAMFNDIAQLTIDTSGSGLHKRNYRTEIGETPIRENLAAALVSLSFWNKERLLVDPMCGSGTILIEAAMMARNIAPGLKREFISEQWPAIKFTWWQEAREAALKAIIPSGSLQIRGYDIDERRIADCKVNAKRAGVGEDIVFEQKDIKDLRVEEEFGIVISNPPYGIKMSNTTAVVEIYAALSALFKNRKGWSIYIVTADKNFPSQFKRPGPDRKRKLFNGTIEVNYYQYYGAKPEAKKNPA